MFERQTPTSWGPTLLASGARSFDLRDEVLARVCVFKAKETSPYLHRPCHK